MVMVIFKKKSDLKHAQYFGLSALLPKDMWDLQCLLQFLKWLEKMK